MAEDWVEDATEIVERAFAIANSPAADEIRAATTMGGGSHDRAMALGLVAAMQGQTAPEEAEPVDAELARLRDENSQLRGILHLDDDDLAEADPEQLELANEELRTEAFGDPDAEVPEAGGLVLDESEAAAAEGEAPASEPSSSTPVDPEAHSKDELIAMAAEQGVSGEGTKAEIAARLS
jgi:hypothetical protein